MQIINYISSVQHMDIQCAYLLQLKELDKMLSISSVLNFPPGARIPSARFLFEGFARVSEKIVIVEGSQLSEEAESVFNNAGTPVYKIKKQSYFDTQFTRLMESFRENGVLLKTHSRHDPIAAELIDRCRDKGGRVLVHLDGSYPPKASIPVSYLEHSKTERADVFLLFSSLHREPLESVGYRDFFTSGYPKLYPAWIEFIETSPYCREYRQRKHAFEVSVLTRGEYRGGGPQILTHETLEKILNDIFNGLDAYFPEDLNIRIKPHPAQDIGFLETVIGDRAGVSIVYDHPALLAATSDLVITTWSTAVVDAMTFGVPCIEYFIENEYFKEVYPMGSSFLQLGVLHADDYDGFKGCLEKIKNGSYKIPDISKELGHKTDLSVFFEGRRSQGFDTIDYRKNNLLISVFDTTICDNNLGNQIIMESVYGFLNEMFHREFFIKLPYLDSIGEEAVNYIKKSDFVFFGGTNALSGDFSRKTLWGLDEENYRDITKVILMGVGWRSYVSETTDYTKKILKHVLHPEYLHSVRDSYTEKNLRAIGIENVVNTGCPTLWEIGEDHRHRTPKGKAANVLLTFSNYNQDVERDLKMVRMLETNYRSIYLWVQGPEDFYYAKHLSPNIRILPPNIESLTDILSSDLDLDYIGTRLHAGIKAMQHHRRTVIIGIDNRAIEMGKDFNFNVIEAAEIDRLERMINGEFETHPHIPRENIRLWKEQFKQGYRLRLQTKTGSIPKNKVKKLILSLYREGSRLKSLRDYPAAREKYRRAVNLCGENPSFREIKGGAYFHLGEIEHASGSWSDAAFFLKKCLTMAPGHKKAKAVLDESEK